MPINLKNREKLNKTFVDSLPYPDGGQVFYWDADLLGFGLYVGTQSKTWFVEKRINGKTKRMALGKYPVLTAVQARAKALEQLNRMAIGIDPLQERRDAKARAVTLGEAFESFLAAKQRKPKTISVYSDVMAHLYGDWQKLPITAITGEAVERRHKKITQERGAAYANLAARTLRSVINFANVQYEAGGTPLLVDNPVNRITRLGAWHKIDRRTGHLKAHHMKAWFDAVSSLDNTTARDYLQFVLMTGCRRNEAAKLQWRDVDLTDRSYTLVSPKNGETVILPLSGYLAAMLANRKATSISSFVFPGDGKGGYLKSIQWQIDKVIAQTGQHFSTHDLRRTFVTIAESLDISSFSIKMLVNHKQSRDITGGYVQLNVERLRQPMEAITGFVLRSAEIKPNDNITPLRKAL